MAVCARITDARALQTVVLKVGDMGHEEFAKLILNVPGVEDILVVEGEQLAYAKVDKKTVDMSESETLL